MPLHIAFNLITSLDKCKCEICQKELKRIKEKYGFKVNKGQAGDVQADRLNPEDHFPDAKKMVCDSQNCDNK